MLHFRPYIPNQTVLFPQRIDEDISENAPVRIVNAIVDSLNLDNFKKLYKETGRCAYHPMDFAFFAIAFNIKKMCAKLAKEGAKRLFDLIYALYKTLRTIYGMDWMNFELPVRKIAA